ncbi:MAG TPA: COX15/CtaA family protein [Nocardioides sp.]
MSPAAPSTQLGGTPQRTGLDALADRHLDWLAIANLVANIGIVVTGAVVRLTGSGLGCPTWPRCTDESYVTHPSMGIHGAIEFGNRMLTFVLAAIALLTFLAAWRAASRGAAWLAFGIGLGVPAQAVIGGITVLTDLNPWIVAFHLLCSLAMIGLCVVLLDHVKHPEVWGPAARATAPSSPALVRRLALATLAVGWVVLYLGTIVTGSGPHAGDENSPRTGLDPARFSHIHAWAVYALVALTVVVLLVARRQRDAALVHAAGTLLAVELAQGVVGYVQYFTDLPIALVALHLLGAAVTSAVLTWVVVRAFRPLTVVAEQDVRVERV